MIEHDAAGMLTEGLGSIQSDVAIATEMILELSEVLCDLACSFFPLEISGAVCPCRPMSYLVPLVWSASCLARLQTVTVMHTQLQQERRGRMNAEMVAADH